MARQTRSVANTFWIIDREADLALAFGTQVLPPGDKVSGRVQVFRAADITDL